MGQIAPRLRSAIPKTVQPVGAEDSEELVQDGFAMAAHMLDQLDQAFGVKSQHSTFMTRLAMRFSAAASERSWRSLLSIRCWAWETAA